jgi:hypothetical protein
MKEKIIAAIKAKYPAINLSKKRLDAIAAKIETKVIDDETKIDAALETYNDFNPLADIAKQDDAIRNYEAKLKNQQPPKNDKPDPEPAPPDDTPAWAKSLIESNKTLSEKLAAIEGEKKVSTIKSTIASKLKEVPSTYWEDWAIPDKDEDVDGFIEKVNTKYTAFTKDLTDKGIAVVPMPGSGGRKAETKEATKEELDLVVQNLKI